LKRDGTPDRIVTDGTASGVVSAIAADIRRHTTAQSGRFVTFLRDVAFETFALVIDRTPQIIHLAVYPDVDLVQMPPPV